MIYSKRQRMHAPPSADWRRFSRNPAGTRDANRRADAHPETQRTGEREGEERSHRGDAEYERG